MSSRLTEVLSRWGGRRQMQAAFEARGFHLHRTWQEERIKACGADQRDGVEHYWDEYALEVVRSAGHVTPETRAWRIPPPYRSPYLDELYRRVDYLRPPYVRVRLIKCLFEYLNWNRQPGVGRREFARFQGLKHGEIGHLAAPDELWTGRKRDVPKIVESIAVGHGFARRGGRLLRSHSSNLTFEIGFDLG